MRLFWLYNSPSRVIRLSANIRIYRFLSAYDEFDRVSIVFALIQLHHIMHRGETRTHVPWPTFNASRVRPRFPSANAIADISSVARDYNVVYCSAFRSTRLHATYQGKSLMIVSRLGMFHERTPVCFNRDVY